MKRARWLWRLLVIILVGVVLGVIVRLLPIGEEWQYLAYMALVLLIIPSLVDIWRSRDQSGK